MSSDNGRHQLVATSGSFILVLVLTPPPDFSNNSFEVQPAAFTKGK
jgi:hypothetical protein